MQQTGTYSTVSSTQPRPGIVAAISAQQLASPTGSARIDVAWTQSQQTSSRKRTFALVGAGAVVLIGGAALFAVFKHDAGASPASTEPVPSATQAPSTAPSQTESAPVASTAAPAASTAAPGASTDSGGPAASTTSKKAPGPVGPVGPRKGPPEAKPPVTATATGQATTRPPVNPLDDRE